MITNIHESIIDKLPMLTAGNFLNHYMCFINKVYKSKSFTKTINEYIYVGDKWNVWEV